MRTGGVGFFLVAGGGAVPVRLGSDAVVFLSGSAFRGSFAFFCRLRGAAAPFFAAHFSHCSVVIVVSFLIFVSSGVSCPCVSLWRLVFDSMLLLFFVVVSRLSRVSFRLVACQAFRSVCPVVRHVCSVRRLVERFVCRFVCSFRPLRLVAAVCYLRLVLPCFVAVAVAFSRLSRQGGGYFYSRLARRDAPFYQARFFH